MKKSPKPSAKSSRNGRIPAKLASEAAQAEHLIATTRQRVEAAKANLKHAKKALKQAKKASKKARKLHRRLAERLEKQQRRLAAKSKAAPPSAHPEKPGRANPPARLKPEKQRPVAENGN